jgi:predicted nuclease of restriction endonuclease-like (RecB) superfamily
MPEIPSSPDYSQLLAEVKERIRSAQYAALKAVNTELVGLYWDLGRMIVERQAGETWGKAVVRKLSDDLRQTFPDMKGFSPRNLKYMRAFAEAWSDESIVQGVLAQLPWFHPKHSFHLRVK